MTVKLYVLPSNTSSRSMEKSLRDNNIDYEIQRIDRTPLSWEQLLEILVLSDNGIEDFLSIRSKEYLELTEDGVDFNEMTIKEFHYVIQRHPKILKVPIAVSKNRVVVGYSEDKANLIGGRRNRREKYEEALEKIRKYEEESLDMKDFVFGDIIEYLGMQYIVTENYGKEGIVREYYEDDNSFGEDLIPFTWVTGGEESIKVGSV